MATQKIYSTKGTAVTFKDSGGTVVMTLNGMANATGRISAQWDRGADTSLPMHYRMRCVFPMEATHTIVLGETISIYLATSDGTDIDGTVGAVDAALTLAKAVNLQFVGCVICDVVAADAKMTRTFDVWLYERYVSVGAFNSTSDHTQTDANTAYITLTPYPDDIQAAA
jgi:hypothetical protein